MAPQLMGCIDFFLAYAFKMELRRAQTPRPVEATRAKAIGSRTNIAIGDAQLAVFRTVSEDPARTSRCFMSRMPSASANEAAARSERRGEAVGGRLDEGFLRFFSVRVELAEGHRRGVHLWHLA